MGNDLREILTGVGETGKSLARGLKNWAAPPGPGTAAGPLGQDASGGAVRYSKDGSPPTPVNPDGSIKIVPVPRAKGGPVKAGGAKKPRMKNVDNSGLKKEPC